MIKQYNFNNKIYTVTNCTLDDIPSHIEKVLSYWKSTNTDIDEQIKVLQQSVDENTAWKVVNDLNESEAVIYCIKLDVKKAQSNLLWMNNKRMFAILGYYLRLTANLHHIYFIPHSKDFIPFKFLVEDYSIRLFHSHNEPLEINLYSKKCDLLYQFHFLKYNIREL